jgi:hypothetical protein
MGQEFVNDVFLTNVLNMDLTAGSEVLPGLGSKTITVQPAAGEIWVVSLIILNAPTDNTASPTPSQCAVYLTDGVNDRLIHRIYTNANNSATLVVGYDSTIGTATGVNQDVGAVNFGGANQVVNHRIYFNNSFYLKCYIVNGWQATPQTCYWHIQTERVL